MIRAIEVRINNIIQDREGRVLRVEKIDDTEDEGYEVSAWPIGGGGQVGYPFKPLPLTEEWLIKFGFDKYLEEMILNDFILYWGHKTELKNFYYHEKFLVKIDYVHQLQNLYFSLTQTELIIK